MSHRLLIALLLLGGCATEYLPPTDTNEQPVASAGDNRSAIVGDVVRLDGSGSHDPDGNPLSYLWALSQPDLSTASLTNDTYVTTSFEPDVAGEFRVTLVVNDGRLDSEPAEVVITVADLENSPPVASLRAPTMGAVGTTVELDGSDSTDPDGDGLFFDWTLEQRPSGSAAQLDDPFSPTPMFTADVPGDYEISLVVTDGLADSAPAFAVVSATAAHENLPPVADAGPDVVIATGQVAMLDGSGSIDPDGEPLTYQWTLVTAPTGSATALSAATTSTTTLQPDVAGEYTIELIVNDGAVDSAPDTVRVTAVSGNSPPTAHAGSDRQARVFETVMLDGSASFDPDADVLTFTWTLGARPAASTALISNHRAAIATFVPDATGAYEFTLTVDDGVLSAVATFMLFATEPLPQALGDLVITEVMADPNVLADTVGEWFELYNPTATAWDLRGCELSDRGTDFTVINLSLVVAPASYVTLARSANPGFVPDYVYSSFVLGNSGDEIILTCGANEISQVELIPQAGFSPSPPTGASLALLRDRTDETANNDGANWCISTSDYNGDKGTPGAPNDFQTTCP